MDQKCDCCGKQQATRLCFSCDPSGCAPVNMCGVCSERAHFGPMKLSHHVKSLINLQRRDALLQSHSIWSDDEKMNVGMCIKELQGCVNDLENQKQADLQIMSSTFEPLKNAVVRRKKELATQIAAHYDSLKPKLADTVAKCKERLKSIDKTAMQIGELDDGLEDIVFSEQVELITAQMENFEPSSIRDMLPELEDGHRVEFQAGWDFDQVLKHINECKLKSQPAEVTDELVTNLTLTSGDMMDVYSCPMEKDGIFWLKLCVPAEKSSPLYQLAFNCRQKLILGETKRYSDHPYDLHTGMVVMVNHPEDGVWYRAIVTDPCVRDEKKLGRCGSASVVVADTGYKLDDIPHDKLAACSDNDLKMPFLAFPCSLYPDDDHPTIGPEARWFYNDLIKPVKQNQYKMFNAKFLHRKSAQHVVIPVWYVELTDSANPQGPTVNHMFEERRAKSAVVKGPIKDVRIATGEVSESRSEMLNMKDDSKRAASPAAGLNVTQTIPHASVQPFIPTQKAVIQQSSTPTPQTGAAPTASLVTSPKKAYVPPAKRQQHPQVPVSRSLPQSPRQIPLPPSPQRPLLSQSSPQRNVASARVSPLSGTETVESGGVSSGDRSDVTAAISHDVTADSVHATQPANRQNPTNIAPIPGSDGDIKITILRRQEQSKSRIVPFKEVSVSPVKQSSQTEGTKESQSKLSAVDQSPENKDNLQPDNLIKTDKLPPLDSAPTIHPQGDPQLAKESIPERTPAASSAPSDIELKSDVAPEVSSAALPIESKSDTTPVPLFRPTPSLQSPAVFTCESLEADAITEKVTEEVADKVTETDKSTPADTEPTVPSVQEKKEEIGDVCHDQRTGEVLKVREEGDVINDRNSGIEKAAVLTKQDDVSEEIMTSSTGSSGTSGSTSTSVELHVVDDEQTSGPPVVRSTSLEGWQENTSDISGWEERRSQAGSESASTTTTYSERRSSFTTSEGSIKNKKKKKKRKNRTKEESDGRSSAGTPDFNTRGDYRNNNRGNQGDTNHGRDTKGRDGQSNSGVRSNQRIIKSEPDGLGDPGTITSPGEKSEGENSSKSARPVKVNATIRNWIQQSPGRGVGGLPPLVGENAAKTFTHLSPSSDSTPKLADDLPITKAKAISLSSPDASICADTSSAVKQPMSEQIVRSDEVVDRSSPESSHTASVVDRSSTESSHTASHLTNTDLTNQIQSDSEVMSAVISAPNTYDDDAWQETNLSKPVVLQSRQPLLPDPPVNTGVKLNRFDTTARRFGTTGCFNCNGPHLRKDCPVPCMKQKKEFPSRQKSTCMVCKKPHRTEECQIAEQAYFKGKCPYCLATDHKMTEASRCCKPPAIVPFRFLDRRPGDKRGQRFSSQRAARGGKFRESNF